MPETGPSGGQPRGAHEDLLSSLFCFPLLPILLDPLFETREERTEKQKKAKRGLVDRFLSKVSRNPPISTPRNRKGRSWCMVLSLAFVPLVTMKKEWGTSLLHDPLPSQLNGLHTQEKEEEIWEEAAETVVQRHYPD